MKAAYFFQSKAVFLIAIKEDTWKGRDEAEKGAFFIRKGT